MTTDHSQESTNEFEVEQVVWVDVGHAVDLEGVGVVVIVGVLEQAVHWIENLVRQQEEPLPVNHTGFQQQHGMWE